MSVIAVTFIRSIGVDLTVKKLLKCPLVRKTFKILTRRDDMEKAKVQSSPKLFAAHVFYCSVQFPEILRVVSSGRTVNKITFTFTPFHCWRVKNSYL